MRKTKDTAISNEEIVSALLANTTIVDAAASLGMSTRAIYDRMRTHDFKLVYESAKADILRQASKTLNDNLQTAVNTLVEIAKDRETSPSARIAAANAIIANAAKISDQMSTHDSYATSHVGKLDIGLDMCF